MELNYSEQPLRVENGKKIFRLDCIIDAVRRASEPSEGVTRPTDQDNSEGGDPAPQLQDDGFVRDRWRLISAVKAWPTTGIPLPQMVDYGHDNGRVLQDAIGIINEVKPDLTWNHSVDAKDVAGHVENAVWELSNDIPPGVNADLVVDPDYDSKAATGLKKGQLRNGSIGFTMDVEPSHPDMEWGDFIEQQGKEVGDTQVRWLPTKVYEVRHMALVPAGTGADRHAGRRGTDHLAIGKENIIDGRHGMEKTMEFFQSVLEKLGIDILLAENSEVTDVTKDRVLERIEKLSGVKERYNELAGGLQAFGKKLAIDEDAPLTALQVLGKLDGLLAMAERGERLVEFKQLEATEWYDKTKFSPDKAELTEAEKRMRGRIMASSDLDYLEDIISEYKDVANARFELNRSSKSEELPPVDGVTKPEKNKDISDSVKRIFG